MNKDALTFSHRHLCVFDVRLYAQRNVFSSWRHSGKLCYYYAFYVMLPTCTPAPFTDMCVYFGDKLCLALPCLEVPPWVHPSNVTPLIRLIFCSLHEHTLRHPLTACPAGTYGKNCDRTCSCGQGSDRCDVITGCVCLSGWNGVKCDRDINECDTTAVQEECRAKNAECVNHKGGYSCRCQQGYVEDDNGTCQGTVKSFRNFLWFAFVFYALPFK